MHSSVWTTAYAKPPSAKGLQSCRNNYSVVVVPSRYSTLGGDEMFTGERSMFNDLHG